MNFEDVVAHGDGDGDGDEMSEPSEWVSLQPSTSQSSAAVSGAGPRACCVCYSAPKTVVLQPCGHFGICETCFVKLVDDAKKAPGPAAAKTKKNLRFVCPVSRCAVIASACTHKVFNT